MEQVVIYGVMGKDAVEADPLNYLIVYIYTDKYKYYCYWFVCDKFPKKKLGISAFRDIIPFLDIGIDTVVNIVDLIQTWFNEQYFVNYYCKVIEKYEV